MDKLGEDVDHDIISALEYNGEVLGTEQRYPCFLRKLEKAGDFTHEAFEGIFESNLVLAKSMYKVGKVECVDNFLCAEVDDKDLPWDINELDW